jgi:AcrR family transcriptional regulator
MLSEVPNFAFAIGYTNSSWTLKVDLVDGVDAATTRTIADRAGVAYPSLYRFFADRDEILDRLLERHLTDIDARAEAAERTWDISSIWDLVNAELELHIAY